jgi:uncharacterized protein YdaU (DUF1376 family)
MEKPNLRPAPCYQEYASDILANREFRLMGFAERGLLWHMRLECWVNKSLPVSVEDLAKTLGMKTEDILNSLSPRVLEFFKQDERGFYSAELEAYRENYLAKRAKLSESGKRGGRTTQSKQRQAKATIEASLKPLSGDESSRYEKRGKELTKEEFSSEDKEWVADYESGTPPATSSYLMQSRGF